MAITLNGSTGIDTPAIETDSLVIPTQVINGITVGKGAGALAGNTALGVSALAGTNSGNGYNTAIGYQAGYTNTTGGYNVFVGRLAGYTNNADNNVAIGSSSLTYNTTGTNNSALGFGSLNGNTTGSSNTGIGQYALQANTTASNNTAVGYQAGYANTTGVALTAIGSSAGKAQVSVDGGTFLGAESGRIATGQYNTIIGAYTGYTLSTGTGNTFVGTAGSGSGAGCGGYVTTGSYNTILGSYNGNAGGLDIRTANNYIVLSDGAGNPRFYVNNVGKLIAPPVSSYTSTTRASNAVLSMGSSGNGADGHIAITDSVAYNYYFGGYNGTAYVTTNNSGGVKLALGATSWSADSDERFKNIKAPITNALSNLATLRTVYGNYKNDTDDVNRLFLIAQDVQKVYPEAIDVGNDEDKTLSLRAVDLIPVLVSAIQELKAEVDSLKAQLNNGV